MSVSFSHNVLIDRMYLDMACRGRVNMVYLGFDSGISDVHGVVLRGWPLKDFVAPGSISSQVVLKTLHDAWLGGDVAFYRLSPAEFTQYSNARTKVIEAIATDERSGIISHPPPLDATPETAVGDQSVGSPPSNSAGHPSSSKSTNSSALASLSHSTFFNASAVIGADGIPLMIHGKAPRKKRSDAGKPKKDKAPIERTTRVSKARKDSRKDKGKGKGRGKHRQVSSDSDEPTEADELSDGGIEADGAGGSGQPSRCSTRKRKFTSAAMVPSDEDDE